RYAHACPSSRSQHTSFPHAPGSIESFESLVFIVEPKMRRRKRQRKSWYQESASGKNRFFRKAGAGLPELVCPSSATISSGRFQRLQEMESGEAMTFQG